MLSCKLVCFTSMLSTCGSDLKFFGVEKLNICPKDIVWLDCVWISFMLDKFGSL